MDCNKTDCIHYKICEEWKSLGNDNYINDSYGNCDFYSAPYEPMTVKERIESHLKKEANKGNNMPQGEWINRETGDTMYPFWERYECNQCHKFNYYSNFCPNCGAEMKVDF